MSWNATLVDLESRLFDLVNGTNTRGTRAELNGVGNNPENGFWYIPTRPYTARRVFRALPVRNFEEFTFVDVGCGKGRMMRLAARHRFHAVVGVEHDAGLCVIARANIAGLHDQRVRVEQVDAKQYEFPATPLVLYLFNPFGEQILNVFLSNLEASLRVLPRQVLIVLVWPEYAHVLERFSGCRLVKEIKRCRIYEFAGAMS